MTRFGPILRAASLTAAAFAAVACNNGPSYPDRGTATPTVEGGKGGGAYPDVTAAKLAFTRQDGGMTATLEDAAWIKFEPDTATASARHPEYFAGLSTIQMTLLTEHFSRPTDGDFLLEDSTGFRGTAKPDSYRGDLKTGFGPRNAATFKLVFKHTMSKDVRWLRLTSTGEGAGKVTWEFPGA